MFLRLILLDFTDDIKLAQPLLTASSVKISQQTGSDESGKFELNVIFDLLLVEEVLNAPGGIQ